jgi:hypothetical protein
MITILTTVLLETPEQLDWIGLAVDLAGKLTITVGLVIAVWSLATGKIIPPSRLDDWRERAKYEQDRADRLEVTLKATTDKIESNTLALTALRDVLANMNK